MGFSYAKDEFSIFLCGANSRDSNSIRDTVREKILSISSKYNYSVFYPEDLFIELIHGHKRKDLLYLENVLASSVNAVAILVESAGTIAELGAFANHQKLSDKLIVIPNIEYKNDNSFINQGPVRYLRKRTSSHVEFFDLKERSAVDIANFITNSARKIAQDSPLEKTVLNPIHAVKFYLALIYVFGPIKRTELLELVSSNEPSVSVEHASDVVDTVINSFHGDGRIFTTNAGLMVGDSGREQLFRSNSKKAVYKITNFLHHTRVESMNVNLRKLKAS